jgi:hypothetical protein
MKILTILVLAVGFLSGVEPVKPTEPQALTDTEARAIREAQLAVAMAIIAKYETEQAAQKRIDDAQDALQTKLKALQKAARCAGCTLSNSLQWQRPTTSP